MYCMSNFIISEARRRRGGVGMTAEEKLLPLMALGRRCRDILASALQGTCRGGR